VTAADKVAAPIRCLEEGGGSGKFSITDPVEKSARRHLPLEMRRHEFVRVAASGILPLARDIRYFL